MSLHDIQTRIAAAARKAGRDPSDITLVAVSKVQPDDRVQAVLDAGQRVFGENRVQEAATRWEARRDSVPGLELHLVGPLQTNKLARALELFDVIQTLDRPRLAAKLAEAREAGARIPKLFVQVNTGGESQKAGVAPDALDAFLDACRGPMGLEIEGLMCIPPVDDDPAPHFAMLAEMAARNGLRGLSMGMSADFETAIDMGATHVRVGSALFGARAYD